MKYLLSLLLFLASCIVIPRQNDLSCFKKATNGYAIFGFQFNKEINGLTFQENNYSGCWFKKDNNKDVWLFQAVFKTQDEKAYAEGESLVVRWTGVLYDSKINGNFIEDIKKDVNAKISKDFAEYSKTPKRLKDFKAEIGEPYKTRAGFCMVYTTEVKDYLAPNKPKEEEYLIERTFGKICYQVGENFLTYNLIMSHRSRKGKILTFDTLHEKLEYFTREIVFTKGPPLAWFDEKQE